MARFVLLLLFGSAFLTLLAALDGAVGGSGFFLFLTLSISIQVLRDTGASMYPMLQALRQVEKRTHAISKSTGQVLPVEQYSGVMASQEVTKSR